MKKLIFIGVSLFLVCGTALASWYPGDVYKMHYPQMPDPNGWDIEFICEGQELADDWQCSQTGPVTDIHFWCSWYEDYPGHFDEVTVKIYDNDANGPFSKPGNLLWMRTFDSSEFEYISPYGEGDQGFIGAGEYEEHNHSYYQQVNITDINDPFIQQEGTIYWLGLYVDWEGSQMPAGWKTSLNHFEDVAVAWKNDGYGNWYWEPMYDPITSEPLDLAFIVASELRDRVAGNMMLINDNAGWCWYQDDKIIYDTAVGSVITSTSADANGFGGVGGVRGDDIDATVFDIATGKRTQVLMCDLGSDDHNMGALWIRPDGKYLHLYCPHYSNPPNAPLTYYRLSTNPHDGSTWDAESNYNWSVISDINVSDGGQLTYSNVHYMSDEGDANNGRLYNIARWNNVTPNISYSDDLGSTWQYMGKLNDPSASGYSNFYHKFRGNGVDRIDFAGCEQHPRNHNNSVFHGYIKNGKSYNSYGVVMDANLYDQSAPSIQVFTPIFIADANQDPNTYHTAWINELELDKDGYPVCLFQTRYGTDDWGAGSGQNTIGAADHRFFYGRFDGSAPEPNWTCTELCKMGTGLFWKEQDYLGMGCIHPDDANLIYVSTPFDPRNDSELEHHEIFRGVTSDKGLTWNWTQITFDSTEDNIRPAIPPWDAGNTAVFWTRGVYLDWAMYDFVLVGMIDRENEMHDPVGYIDASASNTTEADGSPFTPTGPSGSPGAVDDQWHEYTGYGNGGSCYTAGDSGTEDAPTIKTTISGLSDGTYDVFAYFWCDPDLDWGVRGGFTSSDMLCFNKQSSQHAEASQFSGSVDVVDGDYILYRVYIGREEVSGGGSIDVYIDNYDSSYSGDVPTRTTYDGVGTSLVTLYIDGDLNEDGVVDLIDFAILGQGWPTIYDIYKLADIADNWLAGI